jgi:hypothetical protein
MKTGRLFSAEMCRIGNQLFKENRWPCSQYVTLLTNAEETYGMCGFSFSNQVSTLK